MFHSNIAIFTNRVLENFRTKADDCVSACKNLEVAGSRGMGRPRMTWRAWWDRDMKDMGLRPGMAMNREKKRCGIMGRTSDPHKRRNNGRQTSSSSSSTSYMTRERFLAKKQINS